MVEVEVVGLGERGRWGVRMWTWRLGWDAGNETDYAEVGQHRGKVAVWRHFGVSAGISRGIV